MIREMKTKINRCKQGESFMPTRLAFHCSLLASICTFAGASSFAQTPPPVAVAVTLPDIPAPVAVTIDAKSSAFLILDINTGICQPNAACKATVPAIASLLKRARDAAVPVVYATSINPAGRPPTMPEVAPQSDEPTVAARANKFVDTNLEELLKQRNATTLVIVGTAANGAVLYTAFHANVRGFTVVVAEDGISSFTPFNTFLTRHQLLNQPGISNATNKPLAEKAVTLSRTDLITFK
jgi:nicotinamidase-related amidase